MRRPIRGMRIQPIASPRCVSCRYAAAARRIHGQSTPATLRGRVVGAYARNRRLSSVASACWRHRVYSAVNGSPKRHVTPAHTRARIPAARRTVPSRRADFARVPAPGSTGANLPQLFEPKRLRTTVPPRIRPAPTTIARRRSIPVNGSVLGEAAGSLLPVDAVAPAAWPEGAALGGTALDRAALVEDCADDDASADEAAMARSTKPTANVNLKRTGSPAARGQSGTAFAPFIDVRAGTGDPWHEGFARPTGPRPPRAHGAATEG